MIFRLLALSACLLCASVACGADDALDEVNAARAARGLPPFQRDENLSRAAAACADYRAAYLIAGHTSNDFGFLPSGARADGAGCAAWHPGMGWGACFTYDGYAYAGAAWAMGANGQRFMHLYVAGSTGGMSEGAGMRRGFGRRR